MFILVNLKDCFIKHIKYNNKQDYWIINNKILVNTF